jgi:Glucose-repressible protein Grg1
MSAPNFDKPDESLVGKIGNSAKNAANYVTETVKGASSEVSKEANKEQMKGNVGDTSLSGRASGAFGAASDKLDQAKHDASADANKRAI